MRIRNTIICRPLAGLLLLLFLFLLYLPGFCQSRSTQYPFSVDGASLTATMDKLATVTGYKLHYQHESLLPASPFTYHTDHSTLRKILKGLFGHLRVTISIDYKKRAVFIDPIIDPPPSSTNASKQRPGDDTPEPGNILDEVIETGYGKHSRRFEVGNSSHVNAQQVTGQPYSRAGDLLRTIPGLNVANKTDVPWGAQVMEVRGSRTIQPIAPGRRADEPLIVIDGVPCLTCTGTLNQVSSAVGDPQGGGAGSNPLDLLNAADIESVDVLKDALATAHYGGRGANGVVLITLKQPLPGRRRVSVSVTRGRVEAYRIIPVLNGSQYLQLLREGAHASYGTTPLPEDGWDTLRPTHWPSWLYGNRGQTVEAQASATGGGDLLRWRLSGNYQRQEYVYPLATYAQWLRLHGGLDLRSRSSRLHLHLMALHSQGYHFSPGIDLRTISFLSPFLPPLPQTVSGLNWLTSRFESPSQYSLLHARLDYELTPSVRLSLPMGFSQQGLREKGLFPPVSRGTDPAANSLSLAQRRVFTWITEPQAAAHFFLGAVETNVLVGTSLQAISQRSWKHEGDAAAPPSDLAGPLIQYRLQSVFGKVDLNLDKQYLLSLTGRTDASSRFPRADRWGLFWGIGGAWVFSDANRSSGKNQLLSFGKVGLTYGTTGSDQVSDYAHYDQYIPSGVDQSYGPYPGVVQLKPDTPDMRWQRTDKAEATLVLEFWHWLYVQAVYFRHRSYSQAISFPLPSQTGFASVNDWNYPAQVANRGWEFSVTAKDSLFRKILVRLSASYTLPRNQLLSFPYINQVLYTNPLLVGQPLSAVATRRLTGIDAGTGLYTTEPGPVIKDLEVWGFGTLQVALEKKPWSLSFSLESRQQRGYSSRFHANARLPPGQRDAYGFSNQPASVLYRWPYGTLYQRALATLTPSAQAALQDALHSDEFIVNQSYLCLRHLAVQYALQRDWLQRLRVMDARFFLQVQNAWVISRYREGNPMVQDPYALPVTRTISLGIQVSFQP